MAEKIKNEDTPDLFNEAEYSCEKEKPETEPETIEVRYERKKSKGGRKPISDKLPRVEIIHDIPKKNKNLHLAKIGAVKLAVTLLKMFPDLYKF